MKSSKKILIACILNILFVIIEFVGGIFSNSISIISKAIHDLGDSISLFIAWLLERKSYHKPDKDYTFGYVRYSLLGAFITSIVLFVSSIFIVYNAIFRIINPENINYDGMLIFAIFGIIVNGIGVYITSDKKSLNEETVSVHLLDDVLGWFSVIVVSIIGKYYNLPILDPILSICISIFILYNVFVHLKGIINIFLEKKPESIDTNRLKKDIINKYDCIKNINHIHIWSLSKKYILATMHIIISYDVEEKDRVNIKENIRKDLKQININDITIEVDVEKIN